MEDLAGDMTRRSFLAWTGGVALLGALPGSLRASDRRETPESAPFPHFGPSRIYGAGTYRSGPPELLERAIAAGVALIDTSPDYRRGEAESEVGRALRRTTRPVFVMTQIPAGAWEHENKQTAFRRALERSLGRLRRDRVEALLVRNAEPQQILDPDFREFAEEAREDGLVRHLGASGHAPDLEKVLEIGLEDDLLDIFLVGAHLARFGRMEERLQAVRARGKLLVAMKSREAALWAEHPGWYQEDIRRRHAPWDGRWDLDFTRTGLTAALQATGAHNAVLSLRTEEDLAAIVPV